MKLNVFTFDENARLCLMRIPEASFLDIRGAADARGQSIDEFIASAIVRELATDVILARPASGDAFLERRRARLAAERRADLAPLKNSEAEAFPSVEFLATPAPLFSVGKADRGLNRAGQPRKEVRTVRFGNEPLWTIAEVAKRLAMGRSTVGRLVTDGELPCLRTSAGGKSIRIPEHSVMAFIEELRPTYRTRTRRIG